MTDAATGTGADTADRVPAPATRRPVPPGRRRRRRRLLGVAAVVVLGFLVAAVAWYEAQVHEGPPGRTEIVSVPPGASVSAITALLARHGVVGSSVAFRIFLALHGTPTVSSGLYQLRRHDAYGDVRDRLSAGPDVFAVDVTPGTTVAEVSQTVDEAVARFAPGALRSLTRAGAVRSPFEAPATQNLDGLLGPGRYLVLPGETPAQLLTDMVDRFDAEATSVGLSGGAAANGLTPYEAITVASIVQKEAISPGDAAAATRHNVGPVARVIYNRLARGMPLQMDSTVLYAEGRDGGPVTAADLALATPYNTYRNAGLTPTPICFPSALALRAALHPPPGAWLYFVLTARDGTETFSDTLAGQEAAEDLARSRGLP